MSVTVCPTEDKWSRGKPIGLERGKTRHTKPDMSLDELKEMLKSGNMQPEPDTRLSLLKTDSGNETMTFWYDEKGQLTSVKRSSGNDMSYAYDALGHLVEVNASVWEGFGPMYQYTYDENGYLVGISGIGEGGGVYTRLENDADGFVVYEIDDSPDFPSTVHYIYNADRTHADVVTMITAMDGTETTIIHALDFTYDAQGRILTEVESASDFSYSHSYDYSFFPLVLVRDSEDMVVRMEIQDPFGMTVWETNCAPSACSIEKASDGSALRIELENLVAYFE